jgi:mono/diheme cytochrome c family protein
MSKPPILRALIYIGSLLGIVVLVFLAFKNYSLGTDSQWYLTDMMDAQSLKPYEAPMAPLPEGVSSRNRYRPNYIRGSAEAMALENPFPSDEAAIADGLWAYDTYCAPCHGAEGVGNGPVTDNSDGKKRFAMPGSVLAGEAGLARLYADGHLYATIRNGGALMPSYGWAMNDEEIWNVVSYLRSLPGSTQPPPPAPQDDSQ